MCVPQPFFGANIFFTSSSILFIISQVIMFLFVNRY